MSFTAEEVREAVDAFLSSPVKVPSLNTGARDVLLARDRAFALLTNAMVGDPKAIYHLAWMASNRLYGLIKTQQNTLESIRDWALQTQYVRFRPISKTDELTTAQGALLELDSAVSGSGAGASGPGVGQFQRSVRKFAARELQPLLPEIDISGNLIIPDTPLNLRRGIQGTWASVRETDTKIKTLQASIKNMLSDLGKLRLPERSIQSLIGRLRDRTNEIIDEITSADAESAVRSSYLDLLVMDSILSRTTQYTVPSLVTSQGSRATVMPPQGGGKARSSLSGPYLVGENEILELVVNGVTERIQLPPSVITNITTGPPGGSMEPTEFTRAVRAQAIADAINQQSSARASVRLNSWVTPGYAVNTQATEVLTSTVYVGLYGATGGEMVGATDVLTTPSWVTDEDFLAAEYIVLHKNSSFGIHTILSRDIGTKSYTLTPGTTSDVSNVGHVALSSTTQNPSPGDNLDIVDPLNPSFGARYYTVQSSLVGEVLLNEDLVKPAVAVWNGTTGAYELELNTAFSEATFEFFTEYLDVEAPAGQTLSIPDNAVSQKLGLDPGNLLEPITSGASHRVLVPPDLVFLGVTAGDILDFDEQNYVIQGLERTSSGTVITVDEDLVYDLSTKDFRILSERHIAYLDLVESVKLYPDDLVEQFDIIISQVLQGKSATQLSNRLTTVIDELTPILNDLNNFTSPGRSQTLDAAVSMMRELGMDRAVDMLISLDLKELFTMDRDGVSYNTHLVRKAATATRVVSPVSKDQRLDEEIIGVFSSDLGLSD